MKSHGPERDRLRDLVEAAATVAGQTDMRAVLESTINTAMALTGAKYGALGVLGSEGTLSEFLYSGIDQATADEIGSLPEGRGVLGAIRNATVRLDRVDGHPDSVGFPDGHPPMHAFLGVPVRAGEHTYGNLYLTEKEGGFTAEDESLVESLAVIAGSAVATARIHERLQRVALAEERERIARDLHDSVIQDLFAVGLSLQLAASQVEDDPALVRVSITSAVDQLDMSITALRNYIFDVRSRLGDRASLVAAVKGIIDRLTAVHPAQVELKTIGDVGFLPGAAMADALHFTQESLTNALRHSDSEQVDVILERRSSSLVIEVRDYGVGFEVETVPQGMGLDNLMKRTKAAGGRTDITSAPGTGTLVRGEFPIV